MRNASVTRIRGLVVMAALSTTLAAAGCAGREQPRTPVGASPGQWMGRPAPAQGAASTGGSQGWAQPWLPIAIQWPANIQWPAWGLPNWTVPGWGPQPQPRPQPQPQPQPQTNDIAQRCVDGINRYRATKSLPPLTRAVASEPCANNESATDAQSQTPHGSFGSCHEHAQNACPNWPGPADKMIDDCLASMWSEGPGDFPAHGHYENMVDTSSTAVACGVITEADDSLWAVQDFY